ncbi:MAG: twin-arginine translocation signal domain-containing protein, partial [Pseudomonadota bacterium]|nr:twin-arginine translocation signal domain-containing protein [Pseudomonadota bacterium]
MDRMISRRSFVATLAATAGAGLCSGQAAWSAPALSMTDLRGSIDAGAAGLSPTPGEDQTRQLAELIAQAVRGDQWVFLPPGRYEVSNLTLPDRTRLTGIAGATEIAYSGRGAFIDAGAANRIELSNIIFNGAGLALPEDAPALLNLRDVFDLTIDNCTLKGNAKTALQMERCGGRISNCRILEIGEYGLY